MIRRKILYIRSAPINITPAVERYVDVFMKLVKRKGQEIEIDAVEYRFNEKKEKPKNFKKIFSMKGVLEKSVRGICDILKWQVYQLAVLVKEKPEIVQMCDVFSVLPVAIYKQVNDLTVIFDIRDNIAASVEHRSKIASVLLGKIENYGCHVSEEIIVVHENRLKYISIKNREKITVIYNTPLGKEEEISESPCNMEEHLIINLSGFISMKRNLEKWIKISEVFQDIELQVYGITNDREPLLALKRIGLEEVKNYSVEESRKLLRKSHIVSLMYDTQVEINRSAAPNKYYEALMMGKPVICAKGMSIGEEIRDRKCGMCIEYNDLEELKRTVEEIRRKATWREMSKNARELWESKYRGRSRREIENMYERVLMKN